ncbi:hypothetical protein EVAR_89304_1 [Eumeta japonica]|uniref:Uncharacterized protein n=1 Tax=Eumeta variegata TaxID=151549 RepID=A0A4C1ZYZ7_EUMVA|nr:hypothetical protein EVAR_89304_1 [Eumeta japonica]
MRKTDALGRVHVVHPNNSEWFHLRMLLHIVKGPTSFIGLRTIQGVTYEAFQGACMKHQNEPLAAWVSALGQMWMRCGPELRAQHAARAERALLAAAGAAQGQRSSLLVHSLAEFLGAFTVSTTDDDQQIKKSGQGPTSGTLFLVLILLLHMEFDMEIKPLFYLILVCALTYQIARIELVKRISLDVTSLPDLDPRRNPVPYLKRKKRIPYRITLLSVCLSRPFFSGTRGGINLKFILNTQVYCPLEL